MSSARESVTSEDGEDAYGCLGQSKACDPNYRLHRYLILVLMCFLSFGSYFCYDNPGALEDRLLDDLSLSVGQYDNFYAWYSWPNVVLAFVGGYLVDKVFGIRLGGVVFSALILLGQIIFALGAWLNNFYVMVAGRFVFGMGGESLAVVQNTYAVSWFRDSELNMVFGFQLSMSRIGSTVNFMVMEPVYSAIQHTWPALAGYRTMGVALFMAAATCIFSQLVAFALFYFDRRAKRILRAQAGTVGEEISFRHILKFRAEVWLLTGICVAYYVAVFPFISLGQVFWENKFDMSPYAASTVNSLVYFVAAGASPVFGLLIDRFGRNVLFVLFGVMVTALCHALFAFTSSPIMPWLGMVVMGLSYSVLASALWPMVALLLPESQLGTAYGIMQAVQNLGLGVLNLLSGLIVDSRGYLVLEIFYIAWGSVALMLTIVLYIVNSSRDGYLNMSPAERKVFDELNGSACPADTSNSYETAKDK